MNKKDLFKKTLENKAVTVIANPKEYDMEEPEIYRKAAGYKVGVNVTVPVVFSLRVDVPTRIFISECVSEDYAEELVKRMLDDKETTLSGLDLEKKITTSINDKLSNIPEKATEKLRETLSKITSEGAGGLICIIL